jgi:hypothetical protein
MSLFLNFRVSNVGGAVVDPYLLEGDGTTTPPSLQPVPWTDVPRRLAGANLLFAAHGFNVSYQRGACSLGSLDRYLKLPPPALLIGMLWPGDCWLPVVDYPFEGSVSIDCGQRLAAFCNRWCTGAQSLSFLSHSLGARLVLEAVSNLKVRARSVCLTAGAINRDCLVSEYKAAAANADRISILASGQDDVLKLAFSVGDPIADLLHDDHSPFTAALGSKGPPVPAQPPILAPWQIPDPEDYGHGDYLPPSDGSALPPADGARWIKSAEFMRRAFWGVRQDWPTG